MIKCSSIIRWNLFTILTSGLLDDNRDCTTVFSTKGIDIERQRVYAKIEACIEDCKEYVDYHCSIHAKHQHQRQHY